MTNGSVRAIKCMKDSDIWVNGGYFVLRKEVFRYIKPKEELVYEPFRRLIAEGRVWSQRYEGFWQCMDTFRDKQILDELEAIRRSSLVSVEEQQICHRESSRDQAEPFKRRWRPSCCALPWGPFG